jgi:uncharacterized membrane protein
MDKKQFINEFEKSLKGVSKEDKKEIIIDYEEHFAIGKKKGRKEGEIASSLGNPKQLAKQARIELLITKAEEEKSPGNIFRMIFATIGMSFFNLVFVVGIFFAFLAVIIALFAVGFAIVVTGLALIAGGAFSPLFANFISLAGISPIIIILAGIGLAAFGILFTIGTYYIGKGFYILTIKYVKLNIRIIRGREK